jgi:hypothetical protein
MNRVKPHAGGGPRPNVPRAVRPPGVTVGPLAAVWPGGDGGAVGPPRAAVRPLAATRPGGHRGMVGQPGAAVRPPAPWWSGNTREA